MTKHVVVLAGLSVEIHDLVRARSAGRFVPHGRLVVKPLSRRVQYSDDYALSIMKEVHHYATSLPEREPLSIIVCYVNSGDAAVELFIKRFFPCALIVSLQPFRPGHWWNNNNALKAQLNDYVDYLESESRRSIDLSFRVKRFTDIQNLTPLLLPLRNFRSTALRDMLTSLFWNLSINDQPEELISTAVDRFFHSHPRIKAGTDSRHCYSDGMLYFQSPGRHRHGYFRNNSGSHRLECLLNARSRLGGPYKYDFHYDCEPVKGKLASEYPNCHDAFSRPKPDHVNICPNDYVG